MFCCLNQASSLWKTRTNRGGQLEFNTHIVVVDVVVGGVVVDVIVDVIGGGIVDVIINHGVVVVVSVGRMCTRMCRGDCCISFDHRPDRRRFSCCGVKRRLRIRQR